MAVLFAGCGAAPVVWAPADAVDPWPMFRREPRHGGDARDHGALAWEVAWQVELGERVAGCGEKGAHFARGDVGRQRVEKGA